MSYTSYADLYKIEEISFTGGSTILLDFVVSTSTGSPFNIGDTVFTWKLSPYGSKSVVTLSKTSFTIIDSNKVRLILESTDTESLAGKYIQELSFVTNELVSGEFVPVKPDFPLTGSPQTDVIPDNDVTVPSFLYIVGSSSSVTGYVTIDGLDIDETITTETITLNGTTPVLSENIFSTIYSIDFPSGTTGETVTVGVDSQILLDISEVQQGVVIISKKLG